MQTQCFYLKDTAVSTKFLGLFANSRQFLPRKLQSKADTSIELSEPARLGPVLTEAPTGSIRPVLARTGASMAGCVVLVGSGQSNLEKT